MTGVQTCALPICVCVSVCVSVRERQSVWPVLRNERGRDNERPAHRDEEWPPLSATRERPCTETKTIIQKESCITMFTAALYTVARAWKQPKCPLTDEWIKKMWHMYTMKYYSAIKRNEIVLFVVRWMDLDSVIQSEVSQKEKNKYHMLTHIYGI